MLNSFVLVGYVKEINEKENTIILEIPKKYKNIKGEYDTDKLTITFLGDFLESVKTYIEIDNMVGIKGSIEILNNKMILKAEKATFISSKKK